MIKMKRGPSLIRINNRDNIINKIDKSEEGLPQISLTLIRTQ